MIPRSRLDIGWSDLFFGIAACFTPQDQEKAVRHIETLWSRDSSALVCLSVRTGFDLLLTALDYPPGSEILVSAITIRDMVRIVEQHGLVPIPVDLNMQTLTVKTDCLRRAAGPRTKAILVAHLFGSRMPLDDVAAFALAQNLLLIEDCAQSFTGDQYRGHPQSNVTMFSFGPIKTSTALGGAIFEIKDRRLRDQMQALQFQLPTQSRWFFLKRLVQYVFLVLVTYRAIFSIFEIACRVLGKNHDQVISASVRGFPGPDFFKKIRRQPSYPLLALLARRLSHYDLARIVRRIATAQTAIQFMPGVRRPGERAAQHSHWIFPIQVPAPDELLRLMWRKGFDATRGASSLYVVTPPTIQPELAPTEAAAAMQQLLYVPVYPDVNRIDLQRLGDTATEFGRREGSVAD